MVENVLSPILPNELDGVKPGVWLPNPILGLRSFATSIPLPSLWPSVTDPSSSDKSGLAGRAGAAAASFFGRGLANGSGGRGASSGTGNFTDSGFGLVEMKSGGSGAVSEAGAGFESTGFSVAGVGPPFERGKDLDMKSGGNGASSPLNDVLLAVSGELDDPDEDEDSPNGKTALLVVSGGRGASGMSARFSLSSSSSSFLIFGVPKTGPNGLGLGAAAGAGFGAPKTLLEEKMLDVAAGPEAVKEPNLWGVGVVVGVVDSRPNRDFGFSSTGVGIGVLSIFSSLISGAAGSLAASPNERPRSNPLNKEPPVLPVGFSSLASVTGSALNVVPRTNGEAPKGVLSFFPAGGNAVSPSIFTSGVADANGVGGLDPKMEVPLDAPPREPNPGLPAKLANPPDGVDPVAVLPKTLPELGLELAKPDWPNAGAAAAAAVPVAQGDALAPSPKTDACPNAGAAGLLPRGEDWPNAGAAGLAPRGEAWPKAGVGDPLTKVLPPKAGVVDVAPAVAQGDG